MTDFDLDEWKFVISETHKKRFRKNILKRETLFYMQLLLSRLEIKKYIDLKKMYLNIES